MRVLSKGTQLPFVDESVDWSENANFKDYDVVFVNLRTLEEDSHKYDHPLNGNVASPELFDKESVNTFIETGGNMIVYLPDKQIVKMNSPIDSQNPRTVLNKVGMQLPKDVRNSGDISEYDLLHWLPFKTNIDSSESGKSVENVQRHWRWFFGDQFCWDQIISHECTQYKFKSIADNSYNKSIATKVYKGSSNSNCIYLLPAKGSISYSDFVKNTLVNKFRADIDIEGRSPPSWLSDIRLPDENKIINEIEEKENKISELEEELDEIQKYKSLLYERGDKLEEITLQALEKLGFDIDGEIPGQRDGVLQTSDGKFALEITGTSGGIKKSKARQLDDWVDNLLAEAPGESVSGLLIVNPQMGIPPAQRDTSLEPNVEKYLQKRGDYKVLTTLALLSLIKAELDEGVDKTEIEEMLHQENTLISLPEDFSNGQIT